jgi:5-methylcytosine-specific restriction protein A
LTIDAIIKEGEPFLEVHHIEWLSSEGKDVIANTAALCPNCYRKMHILNLIKDKKYLFIKAVQ